MTKTIFFVPVVRRSALSCVWIETGNQAQPLACIWINCNQRATTMGEVSEAEPWRLCA